MANIHTQLIEDCETLLRDGRGRLVAGRLSDLRVGEIPRENRLPLANICRRADLLLLGLKILSSVTGPNRAETVVPTAKELAEYAVLLERCGAVGEALRVLNDVNEKEAPEVPLYRAFCHFKSWDYQAAIPELKTYISATQAPYWNLVGQVNLIAAYVTCEQYDLALDLLERNIEFAGSNGFKRLQGNCFELRAQVQFRRADFAAARQSLNTAEKIFAQEDTLEQFFVRKWKCILKAFEDKDPADLLVLRSEAMQRKDWESVREADLFRLQLKFDPRLAEHLYFGTPFPCYRRRVESLLQRKIESEHYLYGAPEAPVYDVATGRFDGKDIGSGKQMHQVMAALLRDLYRPLRVGGLFAEVYPTTRFDIYSSPGRVHQMQFRFRNWLLENSVPAELVEHQNTYLLALKGPCAFKLSRESKVVESWWPLWNQLSEKMPANHVVTASKVRELLGLKTSSSKRFLNWAVENRLLDREGSNNGTHYTAKAA